MLLESGKTYSLRNIETRETAPFTVREIVTYKGHSIIYGVTGKHGVYTGRGRVDVRERVGMFVYLENIRADRVVELSHSLGGLPLAIIDTGEVGETLFGQSTIPITVKAYPVLNSNSHTTKIPPLLGHNREGYIRRGQFLIEYYLKKKEKL